MGDVLLVIHLLSCLAPSPTKFWHRWTFSRTGRRTRVTRTRCTSSRRSWTRKLPSAPPGTWCFIDNTLPGASGLHRCEEGWPIQARHVQVLSILLHTSFSVWY